KRRSADGSVGPPHARVGNCQASNKAEGSVERLSLFAFTNNLSTALSTSLNTVHRAQKNAKSPLLEQKLALFTAIND
ncbi:hypothetical protein, partial [uncultured Pluralibacter sp.]|uniref:hypothetical protein n=1 Tax=uncultured Pluralibacter sp. TaxID=1490864 RepID=UPI00262922FA